MLTNRATKRSIKPASSTLFTESTYQSKLDVLISSVPEVLREGVAEILNCMARENTSDQEKLKRAKVIIKLCQDEKVCTLIKDMMQDEAAYAEKAAFISSKMEKLQREMEEQAAHDPSFLQHLAGVLGAASLNYVAPGLGLMALGMPVAAAAGVPGVQWFAGQPVGGEDMCLGNTQTCEQGFIAREGNPGDWFAQYNRNVEVAVAGNGIDTSFAQCLSVENVGKAISEFFNANSTRVPGVECIANSGVVRGTMSAIKATNLPLSGSDCSVFSKAMNGLYDACSTLPDDHTSTIIVASIAGAVGVTALISTIVCCCRRRQIKRAGYGTL